MLLPRKDLSHTRPAELTLKLIMNVLSKSPQQKNSQNKNIFSPHLGFPSKSICYKKNIISWFCKKNIISLFCFAFTCPAQTVAMIHQTSPYIYLLLNLAILQQGLFLFSSNIFPFFP